MRTRGKGGPKYRYFCWRPLWMVPYVSFPHLVHFFIQKKILRKVFCDPVFHLTLGQSDWCSFAYDFPPFAIIVWVSPTVHDPTVHCFIRSWQAVGISWCEWNVASIFPPAIMKGEEWQRWNCHPGEYWNAQLKSVKGCCSNIRLLLRMLRVVVCFHSRCLTICKHSCVSHISWALSNKG